MKSFFLAGAIAAVAPGPINVPAENGTFVVHPSTLRVYQNEHGFMQVDVVVGTSMATGSSSDRVGVSGCPEGGGQIGRVKDDGSPSGPAHVWSAAGDKVADALGSAICRSAALRQREQQRKSTQQPAGLST